MDQKSRDKIYLPECNDALLDQCQIETYRASGSGGQHVNVTNSAVRLIHLPTGIVITSQKSRSQYLNKQDCLEKLRIAVNKLNYRKPKRIATRMPQSVKAKNSIKKKRDSEKKALRRSFGNDND